VRDIDTAVADSLKVLDPNRPIREADIERSALHFTITPTSEGGELYRISRFDGVIGTR